MVRIYARECFGKYHSVRECKERLGADEETKTALTFMDMVMYFVLEGGMSHTGEP